MIVLNCNPLNQINTHDYIDIHGGMNGGERKVFSYKKIPINVGEMSKVQNYKIQTEGDTIVIIFIGKIHKMCAEIWGLKLFREIRYWYSLRIFPQGMYC